MVRDTDGRDTSTIVGMVMWSRVLGMLVPRGTPVRVLRWSGIPMHYTIEWYDSDNVRCESSGWGMHDRMWEFAEGPW